MSQELDELTKAGFKTLYTSEDVDNALAKEGTTLLIVNSVDDCAAWIARPGVWASLGAPIVPKYLVTVFDHQHPAIDTARDRMVPFPPSSPSIALFREGSLVHMMERHNIENKTPQQIAQNLAKAYQEFCDGYWLYSSGIKSTYHVLDLYGN